MFYIVYTIIGTVFICAGCEKYTVTDYNIANEKHNINQYVSSKKLSVSENNNKKDSSIEKYIKENNTMKDYYNKKIHDNHAKCSVSNINFPYNTNNNNCIFNDNIIDNKKNNNAVYTQSMKQNNINNINRNINYEADSNDNINPRTKKYYVHNKNDSHLPISKQGLLSLRNTYI